MRHLGRLTVKERTGKSGTAFFRRGIPFSSGELKAGEQLLLLDEKGYGVPVQCRVLQTFKNGDIKWMSAAFETELSENELREFIICSDTAEAGSQDVIAQQTGNTIVLCNGRLRLEISDKRITSLSHNGVELLKENGMNLCIRVGGKSIFFCPTEARILDNGKVYARVMLSGSFGDETVRGTWLLTMYRAEDRLYQEVKINACDEITLEGEWIQTEFANTFLRQNIDGEWYAAEGRTTSVILSSKDIERFRGTVDGITGFIEKDSTVCLAPIQYQTAFLWPDGVSRTFRMELSLTPSGCEAQEAQRSIAWGFQPPTAVISPQRYIDAGWLETVCRNGAVQRAEHLICSLYGQCWHHIEAGKLPHDFDVDYETETIRHKKWQELHRSHPENDYNLWFAFMNSGCETFCDLATEHAEFWTDVMFYRGKHRFLHGEVRYMSGGRWHSGLDFSMSTPYYAEVSGLYLDYMMTGDTYLGECLKEAAYHMLEGFEKNGYPLVSYWFPDGSLLNFYDSYEYQFRFISAIRGMFFMYELYHDERFRAVCESTVDYVLKLQSPNGLFFEAYDHTTMQPTAFYQSPTGEVNTKEFSYADKTYIMLFGMRAVGEYYRLSGYEPALLMMENFADYLLYRMQDDGWYFAPNNTNHYLNQEGGRGCCGVTCSCALNFLSVLYSVKKKRKYLLAMLKVCRFYLSLFGTKALDHHLPVGPMSFLRCAPRIAAILSENKDEVIELSFYDVFSVFEDGATVKLERNPNGFIAKQNYATPNNRVIYYCVNTGGLRPSHSCFDYADTIHDTLSEDEYYRVLSVDHANLRVADRYGKEEIDLNRGGSFGYEIYSDGASIELAEISAGDFLAVGYSGASVGVSEFIAIFQLGRTVKGSVSERRNNEVVIDGKTYKVSSKLLGDGKFLPGTKSVFYLGMNDEIISVDNGDNEELQYAYLMATDIGAGLNAALKLKMLTQSGGVEILPVAENVILNNVKTASSDAYATLYAAEGEMIKIKIDQSGTVKEAYTMGTEKGPQMIESSYSGHNANGYFGMKYLYTDSTYLFVLP